jgi:probable phosphoglycerate mutase
MITRICLIRHGETPWNVTRRIQGQTDIPLNENGRSQAMAMALKAAPYRFSAIYSSDLCRALETAKLLAKDRGLEVGTLPSLRERHYGLFQGITADEGSKNHPEAYAHYKTRNPNYDFETGESMVQFAGRVSETIDALTRQHRGQNFSVTQVCSTSSTAKPPEGLCIHLAILPYPTALSTGSVLTGRTGIWRHGMITTTWPAC